MIEKYTTITTLDSRDLLERDLRFRMKHEPTERVFTYGEVDVVVRLDTFGKLTVAVNTNRNVEEGADYHFTPVLQVDLNVYDRLVDKRHFTYVPGKVI